MLRKHKVDGDYFQCGLATSDVAYSKHSSGASQPRQVLMRKWTLGDVVTAVAEAGLVVMLLEEEQGVKADDKGLPKVYTLVARKA